MPISPANSHGNGYPLGITGATAATRYVGGTASGSPIAGTFLVGDFIIDESGAIYVCTVAGTPGTWVNAGGGATPTLAAVLAAGAAANAKITNLTDGASAQDAAAFGQIPSPISISGSAAGQILEQDGTNFTNVVGIPANIVLPTDAISQTFPRIGQTGSNTAGALLTQRVFLQSIWLPKGVTITSITFLSGTTALSVGVHQVFGLYSSALALLRSTSDDTSTAWASNTFKTLNLTSTYTTVQRGIHYVAILVDATTPPSVVIKPISTAGTLQALAIKTGGYADTGQTSLPNPAAALTQPGYDVYAYVS